MNYFYELDRDVSIKRIVSHSDAKGQIKPLIEDPSQVSILEWEIITGLIRLITDVLHHSQWSLYFKHPMSLKNGKYIFPLLLVSHSVAEDTQTIHTSLLRHTTAWLHGRYMFIERIQVKVVTYTELEVNRSLQFLVKIIYYRVAGIAIESSFRNFRIGRDSIHLLPQVHQRAEALRQAVRTAAPETLSAHIHFVIRLLLRAAFELVSEKERIFTRDVTICTQSFCKHYPEYATLPNMLLSYLTTPGYTLNGLLQSVTEFENLLLTEYSKIINDENHATGKS
ncbi:hypothetical protein [Ohtaekwangia koreensis]|uniref:Uncharacterized protein n=1 Tax=Ohtaekwangia koreensis TaxID=688867 RepID=A0A1T5KL75_9BACT|nr:hypothetical protein [Ohtaekwangia koreensis]SKC64209.1 hypothetical protein SAMN05660236_2303 [Ohtaekwangia koreensis]